MIFLYQLNLYDHVHIIMDASNTVTDGIYMRVMLTHYNKKLLKKH